MTPARRAVTLSLAAALLLGAASLASAEVRSSLSQDQVAQGDTFVLNLQAVTNGQGTAPDLAPLEKDFDVLGTSQSTSVQVINGNVSQTAGWQITLSPKETGTLTIPAIKVGSEESRPLTIEVVDAASLPRSSLADDGVEVNMSVDDGNHYVQQEIPLKLHILSSADIRSAQLSEPHSPDAVITRTGEDKQSRVTIGGKPVTVIERDYLVKPQKSGTITIPPVTLRATVPDPNARARSPFGNMGDPFAEMRQRFGLNMPGFGSSLFDDMMSPGREVVARSEPITLDVKARPASSTGWFLPAKNVEVRGAWEPAKPDFKAGEAARRIVQIVAQGASKEQLPDLTFEDVDGAQVYVERVDDQSKDTGGGTAAIKQYILSVVPTRGGEVTLPEIKVDWLNSETGQQETATLPAETLLVSGPAADSTNAPATPATTSAAQPSPETRRSLLDAIPDSALAAIGAAALLVLLAAIAFAVRSARRRSRPATPTRAATAAAPQRAARAASADQAAARRATAAAAVRAACRRSDAKAAFAALTDWFRAVDATPQTLGAPSADRLGTALRDLEGRLYGPPTDAPWNGRPLLEAFDAVTAELEARGRPSPVGDLPPLYAPTRAA